MSYNLLINTKGWSKIRCNCPALPLLKLPLKEFKA
jgi:hypothetical protein